MGKPLSQYVEYTDELAGEICTRIANGETLTSILRTPGMPTRRAIEKWVKSREDFGEAYREARIQGFDVLAEGCIDIADDGRNDFMETENGPAFNPEAVQRSKLRVWTRLELLKRWDPKRYGDLLKQEHSGGVTLETIVAGSVRKPGASE